MTVRGWGSGRFATRFAGLYLRPRRAGWVILALTLLGIAAWAFTWWMTSLSVFSVSRGALIPLLDFFTLAAACVVGVGVHAPFGDAERIAARPLSPPRVAHLAGLLAWAALSLSAALLAFDLEGARPEDPLLVLLRNLAGFAGLALLAARLVGARLSWVVPMVCGLGAGVTTLFSEGVPAPLTWYMQPGNDGTSWTIAASLLVLGTAGVCLYGARESVDEVG